MIFFIMLTSLEPDRANVLARLRVLDDGGYLPVIPTSEDDKFQRSVAIDVRDDVHVFADELFAEVDDPDGLPGQRVLDPDLLVA